MVSAVSDSRVPREIVSNFISKIDLYLASAAFVFVTVVTLLFVVTRYFYSVSLPALEELTMVIFVWFLYLSMIYCLRKNLHIKVEVIDSVIGERGNIILDIIVDLMMISFTSIMFYYGLQFVLFNIGDSGGATPMLDMPYYIVYAVLPISFGIFTILLIVKFNQNLKNLRTHLRNGRSR